MGNLKKFIIRLYQDTIFRCVFGREGMERYLIGLLNAIFLQLGFPLIKKLTIKNPYQLPKNEAQKTTILDVFAEDENGRKIDVEMQTRNQRFFNKRVVYYAARNYVDQVQKGDRYEELRPSFVVAFVRFPIPDRPENCWVDFQKLTSGLYPDLRYDDITIIYVRIPDKPGMRIPSVIRRQLRDWIRYIGSDVTSKSVIEKIKAREETIKELDEEVKRLTLSKDGYMILTREQTYQMDQDEQKKLIEHQARKKGKKEGKVEMLESFLRARFPEDFANQFQPWRARLYKKSIPALDSLVPLCASCLSLKDFTQKL